MKKKSMIAITLSAMLALGMSGAAIATAETATTQTNDVEDQAQVYLVPGAWYDAEAKETVANTVSGLTALSDAQKAALHLENNVYVAGEAGSDLPTPETTRDGYTFNGWWTITDATVTYVEKVPAAKENVYLYADFRAELSQRKDPVNPSADEEEQLMHYMRIEHQDTGEVDYIPLFVSGTDVSNACTAGYGGPVQFYNEWFELRANDLIQVWVSRIYGDEPTNAPVKRGSPTPKCGYSLERSGANNTANFIQAKNHSSSGSFMDVENPTFIYKPAESHYFRIYIKFYDDGGHIALYMEQMG